MQWVQASRAGVSRAQRTSATRRSSPRTDHVSCVTDPRFRIIFRRVMGLYREMARLRNLLIEKMGNEVGDVIININELLVNFAAASNVTERDERGRDIYIEIVEFSGNIKKQLDANIYE